jgi:hypothetical protein
MDMRYIVNGKEMYIRFEHIRRKDEAGNVSNYGGKTVAYIVDKVSGGITKGESVCSEKDVYNKKLGRLIATGRLFKLIGINPREALNMKIASSITSN